MSGITGQAFCAGHMEPFPFPVDAHTSFIKMSNGRGNHLLLDLFLHRLQNVVAGLICINQGSLTQVMAKKIGEKLAGAFIGQELILAQIDGGSF